MNKTVFSIGLIFVFSFVYAQQGDVEVITSSERNTEPAYRISERPKAIDTSITSPTIKYPLLSLHEQTSITVEEIKAANIKLRPQLSQLYNGYMKLGVGSLLQGLGEVYYNSSRSRKFNWGIHAKHHSEWGKMKDLPPSQYDRTHAKAFGKLEESRYSLGGGMDYYNNGLHYYGFDDVNANRDSIKQRYQGIGFNAFYASHKKDSSVLNYRIGLDYNNFMGRKPQEDSLEKWRGVENYVGLKTIWEYNGQSGKLISNLRADVDISFNNYKYGIDTDSIAPLDTGIVTNNFLAQLRPKATFYGLNRKLKFNIGFELALEYERNLKAALFPLVEVKYSLFNDIFIPYVGLRGTRSQQRYELLANENEFISPNQPLRNESIYEVYGGFKGSISSRITFNIEGKYAGLRDYAMFVNDTIYSSANQFRTIYDTINRLTLGGSISYQKDESIKIDLIGRYHHYSANNNPYVWNQPDLEIIARGMYNVAGKLITTLDFTLETGRKAMVFDPTIEGVVEKDGFLTKKLGVLADINLGVEYRYSKRLSIFVNLNNIAAQKYKRWYNYPVNRFQAMGGITFRL